MKPTTKAALVLSVALGGCLASRGQLDRRKTFEGSPETVAIREVPVFGSEITIEAHDGNTGYAVSGELLAVDTTDVWVLDWVNDVVTVPRAEII